MKGSAAMATLKVDYLVATYDLVTVEAHLPAIAGAVIRKPESGRHLGYRGYWCAETRRAFVGDDSRRVMVSVTSSPAHAAALRIYNKSAESGEVPESGEYVRFELQLRDDYAEKAFTALRGGGLKGWYLHAIRSMIDSFTFAVVRDALNDVEEYHQDVAPLEDWTQRRIIWVERSVIPALKKLFAVRPDYLDTVIKMLYDATRQ
jgi:hypothetical protein